MKRKITWIGRDWGYFVVRDYTEYAHELEKEGVSKEQVKQYFRPGIFTPKEIETQKGSHFLYGEEESLYQSDDCPPAFYEKEIVRVVVEVVEGSESVEPPILTK